MSDHVYKVLWGNIFSLELGTEYFDERYRMICLNQQINCKEEDSVQYNFLEI